MVGRDAPTVCTGMRGMVDTEIVFRGASVDLHSGQFGGAVPNPVHRAGAPVAALHDDQGRVPVPGFYDDVRPPTRTERDAWAAPALRRAGVAGGLRRRRAGDLRRGGLEHLRAALGAPDRRGQRPARRLRRPRAQDDRAALGDRQADVPAGRRPGAGARPRRRPRLRRRAHPGRDRGRGVGDRPGRPAAALRRRLAPRHHDPRGDGQAFALGAEVLPHARGRQRPRGAPGRSRARGPAAFLGVCCRPTASTPPTSARSCRSCCTAAPRPPPTCGGCWGSGESELAFERTRRPSVDHVTNDDSTPIGSGLRRNDHRARGAGRHRPHRPASPSSPAATRASASRPPARSPAAGAHVVVPARRPERGEGGARRHRRRRGRRARPRRPRRASHAFAERFLATGRAHRHR